MNLSGKNPQKCIWSVCDGRGGSYTFTSLFDALHIWSYQKSHVFVTNMRTMKNNNKAVNMKAFMDQKEDMTRAYMLVELQPGKEKEFGDEILTRGLLLDSTVERMDFVHGPFDFIIVVRGERETIDSKLMEIRKSVFVRKTATLICFELFDLSDISERLK